MLNELSARSCRARSMMRDHTTWAVGSTCATEALSTTPFHMWGTCSSCGEVGPGPEEVARIVASASRSAKVRTPLLTDFFPNRPPTPSAASLRAGPRDPLPRRYTPTRSADEEDLSAAHPPSQEDPRLPGPHADALGTGHPGQAAREGPHEALRLA